MQENFNDDQLLAAAAAILTGLNESINKNDFIVTFEKSQFGGYRPKVENKNGKVFYLGAASFNKPEEAKEAAQYYLDQYARGINTKNIKTMKGTYVKESSGKSEFPLNEKDPGEYDYEGSMAKNALRTIIRNAKGLHDMLADDENLPEHVQAAIVKAEEAIVGARDYIESEKELK